MGDRADVLDELLDSGLDYLTGDYLAELAGRPGHAAGFLPRLRPPPVPPRGAARNGRVTPADSILRAAPKRPAPWPRPSQTEADQLQRTRIMLAITADGEKQPQLRGSLTGVTRATAWAQTGEPKVGSAGRDRDQFPD
jgi:hypothetical protein